MKLSAWLSSHMSQQAVSISTQLPPLPGSWRVSFKSNCMHSDFRKIEMKKKKSCILEKEELYNINIILTKVPKVWDPPPSPASSLATACLVLNVPPKPQVVLRFPLPTPCPYIISSPKPWLAIAPFHVLLMLFPQSPVTPLSLLS